MNTQKDTLKSLEEALRLSPDNIPLQLLYIDNLILLKIFDKAEEELNKLIKSDIENQEYRFRLANLYYSNNEISKGIVLIESLVKEGKASTDITLLYIKLLISENEIEEAASVFNKLRKTSPDVRDASSGGGTKIIRSNLPGRLKAGSRCQGAFVAARIKTPSFELLRPSISIKN